MAYLNTDTASQQSTSKGFQAMSQSTGDELNGRFTALQISNEEIKNAMLSIIPQVSSLNGAVVDTNQLLSEIRNVTILSNGHLEDIAKYTKFIPMMKGAIDTMNQKLDRL